MAAILEDENVDLLEVNVDLMDANKVLRKIPDNVGIVDVTTTSQKSVWRNLDDLSEHSYLILALLPCVVLLRVHLLF